MKIINYALYFASTFVFTACQKEEKPVTQPVEFPETSYETLGTFDEYGKPSYLLPRDAISTDMLSFIQTKLPERTDLRTSHPELLASTATADIRITQSSDIYVTYVSNGAGITNAVAFYTYPTATPPATPKDIKQITYFFPHAGGGTPLQPGDKVKIGRFDPGTSVGFVLLQDGWSTATKSLNNDVVHFCSNDVLNPEIDPKLKKHAVLINYPQENKVIIGFEDLDRTRPDCDHDFNDLLLYATVTP